MKKSEAQDNKEQAGKFDAQEEQRKIRTEKDEKDEKEGKRDGRNCVCGLILDIYEKTKMRRDIVHLSGKQVRVHVTSSANSLTRNHPSPLFLMFANGKSLVFVGYT